MCGIAGVLSLNPKGSPTSKLLSAMGDAMKHRGPDGEGVWLSENGRMGLAHRRLTIIDLSNHAAQPMRNEKRSHLAELQW